MKEEDKERTAFTVGDLGFKNVTEWLSAWPMLLRHSSACGGAQFTECLFFLDDILIFSESFDKHLSRLDAVFSRLHKQDCDF